MKKNDKAILGIGLIVLVGFLLVGNTSGLKLGSVVGSTTLGLSQVDLSSNDPTIGGKAWLLTIVSNGGSESQVGRLNIDNTLISDDGSTAQYDLTITTSVDKEEARYQVINRNENVYHVSYEKVGILDSAKCEQKSNFRTFVRDGLEAWCITETVSGVYGTFESPSVVFEQTISLIRADGQVQTGKISNYAQTNAQIGTVAKATWAGSLVSGDSPPSPSSNGVSALYIPTFGGWKTISETNYQSYKTFASRYGGFLNCLEEVSQFGDSRTPVYCIDESNRLESNVLAGKSFSTKSGSGVITGNLNTATLVLPLDKQVFFPVTVLHVRADWLGIQVNVGKPDITSATSLQFQTGSGTQGFIVVKVKNVGTGSASFDVSATCESPFSQVGTSQRMSGVASGETRTINIPISASATSNPISKTCTVKANDVGNPQNFDTQTVIVTVTSIAVCEEGQERTNGNALERCLDNKWLVIKTCGSDEHAQLVNDKAVCVNKPTPESEGVSACADFDITCKIQEAIDKALQTLGLAFIVIMIVAGAFLFFAVKGKGKVLGRKWF